MTWLIPRDELTPDQIRAIEVDPREHRVILGGPGSGKTQILLHRAQYLQELFRVPDDRFRIFVFTNVLKKYIQSALELLDLPEECVCTFDYWCAEYYKQEISGRLPWNRAARQPDFAAIRRGVLHSVSNNREDLPLFDFLLVDEGQDLDGPSFELLTMIAKHVTACMDHNQQIYEQGTDSETILTKLGARTPNVTLIDAFRCSPYIFRVAAQFIDDEREREAILRQVRTEQGEREAPVLYFADDFEDEKDRLIEIVKVRQGMGDRIAILFPLNRKLFGFAKALREAGLEVETPKRERSTGEFFELDFDSDCPKLLTYNSVKGLTFDSILMPRLIPSYFPNQDDERIERLLYVGICRATRWVYMSTQSGSALRSLDKLLTLSSEPCLEVQHSPVNHHRDHTKEDDETKDDLLDVL